MALPRIIISSEPTVYHVITRVSRGEFLFGELEKERMRKMIWQMADFCGVEVLTYAVMSNHLHLVVRVPVKEELDGIVENAEVLRRFGVLYGAQMMRETGALLAQGEEAEWATFRAKYLPLMHDLSWFVRLLKQRFARWYNAFHKTFGTLWAERFTSVIVEGDGEASLAVCAYVDLNDPSFLRLCRMASLNSCRKSGQAVSAGETGRRSEGLSIQRVWRSGGRKGSGASRIGTGFG